MNLERMLYNIQADKCLVTTLKVQASESVQMGPRERTSAIHGGPAVSLTLTGVRQLLFPWEQYTPEREE